MTISLRIFLILGSAFTCVYVLLRIRKSKMKTESSLFWIFFSFIMVLLGVFPRIAEWFSKILGVQSPANLVFLVVIFLFAIKIFLQDQKLARTEANLLHLTQVYTIDKKDE